MAKSELRTKLRALIQVDLKKKKTSFKRAGEMGQLVKSLPLKHRDLSLDTHPYPILSPKSQQKQCDLINSEGARQIQDDSWSLLAK